MLHEAAAETRLRGAQISCHGPVPRHHRDQAWPTCEAVKSQVEHGYGARAVRTIRFCRLEASMGCQAVTVLGIYVSAEARCIGDSDDGQGVEVQSPAAEQPAEKGNDIRQPWVNLWANAEGPGQAAVQPDDCHGSQDG